jgi:16S rRNA (cytosine967-C5)-methyltransferase
VTPTARLQSILEILQAVIGTARPADGVISHYFRQHRFIGAKDRPALSVVVYAILRHRARLSWWCQLYHEEPNARLLLMTWLRLQEGRNTAAVEAEFSGKKFAPAPLSDREQKYLKKLIGHNLLHHPRMPDAVRMEMPDWLMPHILAQFGEQSTAELAALLEPAPLDLRVNLLKTTPDAALTELQAESIEATPTPLSPWGLRLGKRLTLPALPAFRDGRVEVQDEGSQLVALLCDARSGMRIADFCAGAGGKTLALAASMRNKGRIIALDVLEKRLTRAAERFRRAGAFNITPQGLQPEGDDPWVQQHQQSFDRVLVDAPCSGSGTWRRNPDARWRFAPTDLEELVAKQQMILSRAASLVKPNGRLIYATCSLLVQENQEQVAWFLARHPEFEILPYQEIWKNFTSVPAPTSEATLQLTPAQHQTDGFFTALFVRRATAT